MKLKTLPLLAILITPLYMAACTTSNDITINPSASPSPSMSSSIVPSATLNPTANPTPFDSAAPGTIVSSSSPDPGVIVSASPAPTSTPVVSIVASPAISAPGFVTGQEMMFMVNLVTTEETPPVMTKAKGTASFAIDPNDKSGLLDLSFDGLTGIETGAHIHGPALKGFSSSAIISLPLGQLNRYKVTFTDEQLNWLREGKLYINVQSSFFKDGEIRGQLKLNNL